MRAARTVALGMVVLALASCADAGDPSEGGGATGNGAATSSAVPTSGHDVVSPPADPAGRSAVATVPGPAPVAGKVLPLPTQAVPAVAGYSYAEGNAPGAPSIEATGARAASVSGSVTRIVRRGSAVVGYVTVYRLTDTARNDPTVDAALVPTLLGPYGGQQLPTVTTMAKRRVHVVGGTTTATAWVAGPRVIVVWGPQRAAVLTFTKSLATAAR